MLWVYVSSCLPRVFEACWAWPCRFVSDLLWFVYRWTMLVCTVTSLNNVNTKQGFMEKVAFTHKTTRLQKLCIVPPRKRKVTKRRVKPRAVNQEFLDAPLRSFFGSCHWDSGCHILLKSAKWRLNKRMRLTLNMWDMLIAIHTLPIFPAKVGNSTETHSQSSTYLKLFRLLTRQGGCQVPRPLPPTDHASTKLADYGFKCLRSRSRFQLCG